MAVYSGTAATARIGTVTTSEIKEWSLDLGQNVVDVTAFSEEWERKISGIRNATGSFSGNFDDTDTNQLALINALLNGTSTNLRLYLNGTKYFNIGTAFVTGTSPSTSYDGAAQTSYSFTASGAVTFV